MHKVFEIEDHVILFGQATIGRVTEAKEVGRHWQYSVDVEGRIHIVDETQMTLCDCAGEPMWRHRPEEVIATHIVVVAYLDLGENVIHFDQVRAHTWRDAVLQSKWGGRLRYVLEELPNGTLADCRAAAFDGDQEFNVHFLDI